MAQLDTIVFQDKLGSLGDKVRRTERLAATIAKLVDASPEDAAYAERAAHLAKADLVSSAVVEFTDLQGVMGGYYAAAAGEEPGVAEAIVDHYRPRFAGDDLPRSMAGASWPSPTSSTPSPVSSRRYGADRLGGSLRLASERHRRAPDAARGSAGHA